MLSDAQSELLQRLFRGTSDDLDRVSGDFHVLLLSGLVSSTGVLTDKGVSVVRLSGEEAGRVACLDAHAYLDSSTGPAGPPFKLVRLNGDEAAMAFLSDLQAESQARVNAAQARATFLGKRKGDVAMVWVWQTLGISGSGPEWRVVLNAVQMGIAAQ